MQSYDCCMPCQKGIELPSEYNTLSVGIALYDPQNGMILDANERVETILGYTTEQLRDRSIESYTANTHPRSESDFQRHLYESTTDSPRQFTWRFKRADGELIWAEIELSRQTVADRPCVRAEIRDITDYYETYHRAELFWRILRHNLRNEATIIAGNMSQIIETTTVASVREAATTIRNRGRNLSSIAESVKEIEQAVTQTETELVRRHATTAVEQVVDDVECEYPSAEISITERDEMWIAGEGAFTHALTHALENAIVHSEDERPAVDVSIGSSPNTGRVEIDISDSNPPIHDDEFDALFTPDETTPTCHGSGVGLFVMKWCIESLGGEIEFKQRDPQGNIVRLQS